ncbi:rhomboid family protein [Breznakibacter xylanolyticus]|uniref:Rhomboid family protein n=1 Tax=Breznakibacter xylanolyticus TaxID=990 RepID=A0A2W7QFI8_9BACT|nr:rhomboid family intramembrane serine protease [Breznakibacter xylanolyticus]MBN2742333.1 rhomboid family intramembrane serine protease [Marinilabiliaceae bacterium]PZX20699.1 rhomboid family protein [Breznakibacter xylanolyticus]
MQILILIIAAIGIVSVYGFSNADIVYKLQFNAWQIIKKKEYHRLISHALVHGGWMHLLLNMFVLYSFGQGIIMLFNMYFPGFGTALFVVLFISAIPISSLYSLQKEKNNYHYNAIGASGGVMAVVFTSVFLEPYHLIYVYFIPVPAILFGIIYLIYTKIMANRNQDNIGHDAHFWGALYGFVFPLIIEPKLGLVFLAKLLSFKF